jgi:acetolactate decarboxylase
MAPSQATRAKAPHILQTTGTMRRMGLALVQLGIAVAPLFALPAARATVPTLYVYSTIDALLSGACAGGLTIRQLQAKGDFWLRTFNQLVSDMLAFGGMYHHFRADGSVTIADQERKTPLA